MGFCQNLTLRYALLLRMLDFFPEILRLEITFEN